MKAVKISTLVLLFVTFTFAVNAQTSSTNSLAAQTFDVGSADFKALIDNGKALLLDIRTPQEFAAGHIERAVNIDWYSPDFQVQISKLDREVPLLIYCRSGNRTGQAKSKFAAMGFKSVANLKYGIIEWTRLGYVLVK